jgi:hypothetical protein
MYIPHFVPTSLREAAQVFEQRNEMYGDNYKKFGAIMNDIFPDGFTIDNPQDWNRFGILIQVVSKLTRYAENFNRGGHDDSLVDLSVYAHMLRELDTGNK